MSIKNILKASALFVSKELTSSVIMIGIIGGVTYAIAKSDLPKMVIDTMLKEPKVIEEPAYTCDGKTYDKVFESCRRSIVDGHYDLYKKQDNRIVVNGYCEGIAKTLTCELIETGDAETDEVNNLRQHNIPTAETIISWSKK